MPYHVQDAKDLFIVDNSDVGWGFRYLDEWCESFSQYYVANRARRGYWGLTALMHIVWVCCRISGRAGA